MNAVLEYIDELTKRIETAQSYMTELTQAERFLQQFPDPPDIPSYDLTRISLTLDSGTVKALMINRQYNSLAEVTEHLRWFAKELGKYTIEDYPELQRRAYVFNKGRLRFQCFFSSKDGNVCKFVWALSRNPSTN